MPSSAIRGSRWNRWCQNANDRVAGSIVGRRFRLEGSGHRKSRKDSKFTTEVRAGFATFFAMAYIISVNATILADSGGPCVCNDTTALDPFCMKGTTDVDYNLCLGVIRRDFITGTAAIAALASFSMGLFANMPIALAPGMGLNAYFTYTVVGYHGSGPVSYRLALTAIFMEGFVFIAMSIFGLRQWLARIIPNSIKLGTGAGIGLYLALIGLTLSAGIGAVTGSQDTPLELAGCHKSELVDGVCPHSTKMRSPMMWVGIFCGGFVTAILITFRFKGAIIAGILLVSIISWPRNTPVTYFTHDEVGDAGYNFFKQVVTFHPIEKVLVAQDWDVAGVTGQFGLAFITFLYVDVLDATGTLYSMARFSGLMDPKTLDFEGSATALLIDAMSITLGSLLGLSPCTAFVESGAGISDGGKTGITAMVTGILFFISIFFAPIFASIPPWATGCTLIIVGAMMMKSAAGINFNYWGDALPAFITLMTMPFTYSIAYGLISGICSYAIINGGVWFIGLISGGKLVPYDFEHREVWTWRLKGNIFPDWLKRLFKGSKHFWRKDTPEEVATREGRILYTAPPTRVDDEKVAGTGEGVLTGRQPANIQNQNIK